MNFNNIYTHGVVRVAAATFEVTLGDPHANATKIIELARAAAAAHAAVLGFPRDCLAGATVGDWGGNALVTDASIAALQEIASETADLELLLVLGARLAGVSRAVFITGGMVSDSAETPLGIQAENLPGLRVLPLVGEDLLEAYFATGAAGAAGDATPSSLGVAEARRPHPPTLLVNLAAPAHTVGARRHLHRAARELSRSAGAAVVVAAGSRGESSTDSAYGAASFIACDGQVLAAEEHLGAAGLTLADIVLPELLAARGGADLDYPGWAGSGDFWVDLGKDMEIPLLEPPAQRPLVPGSPKRYRADLTEAFEIQVAGLMRRLSALRDSNIVLGLSGGLDSTLALLVAVAAKAARAETGVGGVASERIDSGMAPHEAEADRTNSNQPWHREILAFTMPGFATGAASKGYALQLAAALGVTCEEIDIRATATEMLRTIGHPAGAGEAVYDVTFENVQAGLRADYLFRLANQRGGFVLGTGDLSEAALGWCTYGVGDHMSHYAVNAGVPKSLMPDLIRVAADVLCSRGLVRDETALHEVISGIIDADITPELIPDHADAGGEAHHQTTEGTIGPYLLHDFFLYHTLRGAGPRLVAFLAFAAFAPDFSRAEILKWLRVFYRRFLTQQFKRTASVASPVLWEGMSLSPRTGFRFPADMSPEAALTALADL